MTIEQIRKAYHAEPFRAFVLHLADGGAIPVVSREFFMIVPSGRTIVVAQRDDGVNIIDLLLVTDLEFKPAGNGTQSRRRK